ncbi:MAG: T9SS type A sorting domain-containing protein, partial [Rhodothermales bacterium]|nr:T9SS type A sorting domain-containing protein [Rhodothermales bacterium]
SGIDPGMLHIFSVDGFTTVSVSDPLPSAGRLNISNYPNPFTEETRVTYSGAGESEVTIYDQTGREVFHQYLGRTNGRSSFMWSAEGVAPSVYFARISSGSMVEVTSLTVVN